MSEKVCLITGASSGIGRATAKALVDRGASVLMVCRNKEKAEAARDVIKSGKPGAAVEIHLADLSSQMNIRRVASEIRHRYSRIDVMINNAGAIYPRRSLSIDGIEMTFALNHLGYFLLTNLLLEPLKAAPVARIINVSSQTHRYARMAFDDLGMEKGFSPMMSYAQSKLANILFTYELARRLDGTNITVNAMHPGAVRTDLSRELTGVVGSVYRKFGFLMRTPERGAETVIWLATSEEAAGESGKYFFDTKEIRSSRYSYDAAVARRLWSVSAELTGLSD